MPPENKGDEENSMEGGEREKGEARIVAEDVRLALTTTTKFQTGRFARG